MIKFVPVLFLLTWSWIWRSTRKFFNSNFLLNYRPNLTSLLLWESNFKGLVSLREAWLSRKDRIVQFNRIVCVSNCDHHKILFKINMNAFSRILFDSEEQLFIILIKLTLEILEFSNFILSSLSRRLNKGKLINISHMRFSQLELTFCNPESNEFLFYFFFLLCQRSLKTLKGVLVLRLWKIASSFFKIESWLIFKFSRNF